MAKSEAKVEELVAMIERGELRLPEMQRRYVWKATRVRDLLDSLYRGYPSGAILLWETDESVPLRDFAIQQVQNPYQTTKLLLDGQQRLTSLWAVLRGNPIQVRCAKSPSNCSLIWSIPISWLSLLRSMRMRITTKMPTFLTPMRTNSRSDSSR